MKYTIDSEAVNFLSILDCDKPYLHEDRIFELKHLLITITGLKHKILQLFAYTSSIYCNAFSADIRLYTP